MHDEFVGIVSRGLSAVQAGARVLQLTGDDLTIPRVTAGVTPAWRSEGGAVAEADPTFEASVLTPRSLSLMVKVSRELLADGFEMERVLAETIGAGVAAEIERATYRGTGVAPQPLGLTGRTLLLAPGEVVTPLDYWTPLNTALWSLFERPQPVNPNALVTSHTMLSEMANMRGADGHLREPPKKVGELQRIGSRAMLSDEAYCHTAVIGDFTQLLYGWRGDIRIELLRERFADTGQVAFMVHARVGFELLNQWAFVILRRLKVGQVVH